LSSAAGIEGCTRGDHAVAARARGLEAKGFCRQVERVFLLDDAAIVLDDGYVAGVRLNGTRRWRGKSLSSAISAFVVASLRQLVRLICWVRPAYKLARASSRSFIPGHAGDGNEQNKQQYQGNGSSRSFLQSIQIHARFLRQPGGRLGKSRRVYRRSTLSSRHRSNPIGAPLEVRVHSRCREVLRTCGECNSC